MSFRGCYNSCSTCVYKNGPFDDIHCLECSNLRNYRRITETNTGRYHYHREVQEPMNDRWKKNPKKYLEELVEKVIFNPPATIVYWKDGFPKTVVRCQEGDPFDYEKGLAMCIAKRVTGNTGAYCDVFKKWCGDNDSIRYKKRELRDDMLVLAGAQLQCMIDDGQVRPGCFNRFNYKATCKKLRKIIDKFVYEGDNIKDPFDQYLINSLMIRFGKGKKK